MTDTLLSDRNPMRGTTGRRPVVRIPRRWTANRGTPLQAGGPRLPRPWIVRSSLCVALFGTLALAGCETPQQAVATKEDQLAAAGFVERPANTPQRQAMLNTLPPHTFLRRVHGDTVSYVYSDPLVCDCLYVGSQQAYGKYRLLMEQQRIANQQELAAEEYDNAAWNWGAWGPWGAGFGPAWGFGPGPGW